MLKISISHFLYEGSIYLEKTKKNGDSVNDSTYKLFYIYKTNSSVNFLYINIKLLFFRL